MSASASSLHHSPKSAFEPLSPEKRKDAPDAPPERPKKMSRLDLTPSAVSSLSVSASLPSLSGRVSPPPSALSGGEKNRPPHAFTPPKPRPIQKTGPAQTSPSAPKSNPLSDLLKPIIDDADHTSPSAQQENTRRPACLRPFSFDDDTDLTPNSSSVSSYNPPPTPQKGKTAYPRTSALPRSSSSLDLSKEPTREASPPPSFSYYTPGPTSHSTPHKSKAAYPRTSPSLRDPALDFSKEPTRAATSSSADADSPSPTHFRMSPLSKSRTPTPPPSPRIKPMSPLPFPPVSQGSSSPSASGNVYEAAAEKGYILVEGKSQPILPWKKKGTQVRGTYNDLYALPNKSDELVKILQSRHTAKGDQYYQSSIDQYKVLKAKGMKVAEIFNADTALKDGYLRVRKIPHEFFPANHWHHNKPLSQLSAHDKALLDQFTDFVILSLRDDLHLDLDPSNFGIDHDGRLTLVDFREEIRKQDIRFDLIRNIKSCYNGNKEILQYIVDKIKLVDKPIAQELAGSFQDILGPVKPAPVKVAPAVELEDL